MTVKVQIPSIFARYTTGKQTSFDAEGKTIGECIRYIGKEHPQLQKMLLAPDGSPLNSIDIFLNGESVYPKPLERPVRDGDKIDIIILIQGG